MSVALALITLASPAEAGCPAPYLVTPHDGAVVPAGAELVWSKTADPTDFGDVVLWDAHGDEVARIGPGGDQRLPDDLPEGEYTFGFAGSLDLEEAGAFRVVHEADPDPPLVVYPMPALRRVQGSADESRCDDTPVDEGALLVDVTVADWGEDWPWRFVIEAREPDGTLIEEITWSRAELPDEALPQTVGLRLSREQSDLDEICVHSYWRGPTGAQYGDEDRACQAVPAAAPVAGCQHAPSAPAAWGLSLLTLGLLGAGRRRA